MKDKERFKKFFRIILVICCILLVFGFSFTVFEAIAKIKGLALNKYQSIIELGNICMRYAGIFTISLIVPGIVVIKDKLGKNNFKFITIIFVIISVIYIINLVYDLGFVIGNFLSI